MTWQYVLHVRECFYSRSHFSPSLPFSNARLLKSYSLSLSHTHTSHLGFKLFSLESREFAGGFICSADDKHRADSPYHVIGASRCCLWSAMMAANGRKYNAGTFPSSSRSPPKELSVFSLLFIVVNGRGIRLVEVGEWNSGYKECGRVQSNKVQRPSLNCFRENKG